MKWVVLFALLWASNVAGSKGFLVTEGLSALFLTAKEQVEKAK